MPFRNMHEAKKGWETENKEKTANAQIPQTVDVI